MSPRRDPQWAQKALDAQLALIRRHRAAGYEPEPEEIVVLKVLAKRVQDQEMRCNR